MFCFSSDKLEPHTPTFNMGYLVSPYSYANGTPGGLPVTMVSFTLFFLHFYVLQYPSPDGKYCEHVIWTCHTLYKIENENRNRVIQFLAYIYSISKAFKTSCIYTYISDNIGLNTSRQPHIRAMYECNIFPSFRRPIKFDDNYWWDNNYDQKYCCLSVVQ